MAVKTIMIVGGGTAGWMTAAALSRLSKSGTVNIKLVESEEIGTVGVGEATIPVFVLFNKLLELDEAELMSQIQGTYKLGIQFTNWGKLGDSYFHPFGDYGYQIDGVSFHHMWLKARMNGDKRPLHAFSAETLAAMHRRFAPTPTNGRSDLPPINYAYHLNAGDYAKFLRRYAEERGVTRIEGRVETVALDPESGNVDTLTLANGDTHSADLFVDCSGFRGLLIEQALQTGYEDWTRWLPVDRAIAVGCEQNEDPLPYTRATAHGAGWQWRVPLQNRLGNGHVYSSAFMEDDEAHKILMGNLDGKPMGDPKQLYFKTGHRKKFWNKNVVAIGLSAGFMEPLESTSIHLINTAIKKLVSILSVDEITPLQADIFNRLTLSEYRRIRDFLVLHYYVTERDDTDFWNHVRTMDVPHTLTEKIELYKLNGQVFREEDELFTETSWVAVLAGQGVLPRSYNPMVDAMDSTALRQEFDEIEKSVRYLVSKMPTHGQFISQFCPSKAA